MHPCRSVSARPHGRGRFGIYHRFGEGLARGKLRDCRALLFRRSPASFRPLARATNAGSVVAAHVDELEGEYLDPLQDAEQTGLIEHTTYFAEVASMGDLEPLEGVRCGRSDAPCYSNAISVRAHHSPGTSAAAGGAARGKPTSSSSLPGSRRPVNDSISSSGRGIDMRRFPELASISRLRPVPSEVGAARPATDRPAVGGCYVPASRHFRL